MQGNAWDRQSHRTKDRADRNAEGSARRNRRRQSGPTLLLVLAAVLGSWCLAGAVRPARAEELVTNGTFDEDLSGWRTFTTDQDAVWSSVDADGSSSSGSARLTNSHAPAGYSSIIMTQCIPVTAGHHYRVSAKAMVEEGQSRTGGAGTVLAWFPNSACSGNPVGDATIIVRPSEPGSWVEGTSHLTAPPGAVAAVLRSGLDKTEAGGSLSGFFDDFSMMPEGEAPPPEECGTIAGPALTDSDFPGFRFRVEIDNGSDLIPAASETACLPETLCVSGALPGRTEAEIRLIGPRPNGYLWLQVIRFTPSKLRIEAEKVSDGTCRVYTLNAIPPASDSLDGFVDRTAFTP